MNAGPLKDQPLEPLAGQVRAVLSERVFVEGLVEFDEVMADSIGGDAFFGDCVNKNVTLLLLRCCLRLLNLV